MTIAYNLAPRWDAHACNRVLGLAKSGGRNRTVCYGQQIEKLAPDGNTPRAARAFESPHADPLTGVLNRRMLRDRLSHAMDRAVRNEIIVALLLLNVKKFKEINGEFGYEGGDAVLVQATGRCGVVRSRPRRLHISPAHLL